MCHGHNQTKQVPPSSFSLTRSGLMQSSHLDAVARTRPNLGSFAIGDKCSVCVTTYKSTIFSITSRVVNYEENVPSQRF